MVGRGKGYLDEKDGLFKVRHNKEYISVRMEDVCAAFDLFLKTDIEKWWYFLETSWDLSIEHSAFLPSSVILVANRNDCCWISVEFNLDGEYIGIYK